VNRLRTLVLGVGNSVRSDDGVGLHVVQRLVKDGLPDQVSTAHAGTAGLGILDLIVECDRLIIVDAIDVGMIPGRILELSIDDLETMMPLHATSSHEADFATVLAFGKKMGLKIPDDVRIMAVQIQDITSFGETCTAQVARAIPEVCDQVRRLCRP